MVQFQLLCLEHQCYLLSLEAGLPSWRVSFQAGGWWADFQGRTLPFLMLHEFPFVDFLR